MIIVSVPFASANGRGSILRLCLQLLPFDFLAERPHDNGDGDGIHAEKGSQFEYQRQRPPPAKADCQKKPTTGHEKRKMLARPAQAGPCWRRFRISTPPTAMPTAKATLARMKSAHMTPKVLPSNEAQDGENGQHRGHQRAVGNAGHCYDLARTVALPFAAPFSAGEGTHPRGSARLPVRGSPFGLARVRGAAQVRGLREQGPRRRTHPRPNRPRPRHSFPRRSRDSRRRPATALALLAGHCLGNAILATASGAVEDDRHDASLLAFQRSAIPVTAADCGPLTAQS